jgi:RNA polymerase sigma-54 factor
MLSLKQQQRLEQKLSPQQIQYQKLLQLNTLGLEQRIKTELEMNPFLEGEMEQQVDDEKPLEENGTETIEDDDTEERVNSDDEFSVEDYMNDEDYFSDAALESPKNQNTDEHMQPYTPSRESLSEHLLNQLYMLDLDDNLILLGEEIIGNLDDDGYLKRELPAIVKELEVLQRVSISLTAAEWLLKKMQTFDPIGIAARTLQECLLVQLQHSHFDEYYSFLAQKLLFEYFEDFSHKRYDLLMQKMNLSEETLRAVLLLVQGLNPKPGEGNIDLEELNQITPDFIIERDGDNFLITLNDRSLPTLAINRTYLELLQKDKGKKKLNPMQKSAYLFMKEKFESARWFIACIEQRRNTMMRVMRSILEKQYEFFEKGPKFLHPMIYKDIADDIGMDISTISRVVSGKFVQSVQGVHELKYFFSEGLATDSGEEIANKHIKELIKEMIEGEGKRAPLSDDKIAHLLNKQGIHIARRTVAKYREALRIPVARLRKGI